MKSLLTRLNEVKPGIANGMGRQVLLFRWPSNQNQHTTFYKWCMGKGCYTKEFVFLFDPVTVGNVGKLIKTTVSKAS